jgi:hypothetical protein
MKSMLISTAIILAIGLGDSFIYHLFAPHAGSFALATPYWPVSSTPAIYQNQFIPPSGARLHSI